jgi:large subunit ribosomal protein L15
MLNTLKRKNPNKKHRQVGRGGKRGTTSGKGTKGQKSRSGHRMRPELRDIIKKLPKLRGRGKNINTSIQLKAVGVNLATLEANFKANETITAKALVDKKLVRRVGGKNPIVKILGKGELSKALSIKGLLVSATAKEAIAKAGGTVA